VRSWLERDFARTGQESLAGRTLETYRRVPLAPLPDRFTFGDRIALTAVRVDPASPRAGQPARVLLEWRALAGDPRDFTVFVHLLDERDTIVAQIDSQPLAGRYPTSGWRPGERVLDEVTLALPATARPGSYRLAVGLYHQPTMTRLIATGPAVDADRAMLPTIRIEVSPAR
jgi:hypothetical protein